MGSKGLPIATVPASSAAMTGAHAPSDPGTAAAAPPPPPDQGTAAAPPGPHTATVLDLLPATLADIADSLRAIRFELAEIRAGQHPPPPSAAATAPPPPTAAATAPPPSAAATAPPPSAAATAVAAAHLHRQQDPPRVPVAGVALADPNMG